jgi:hypothetical protein
MIDLHRHTTVSDGGTAEDAPMIARSTIAERLGSPVPPDVPREGRDGRRLIGGGLLLRRTPEMPALCSSTCASVPSLRDARSSPASR